jgi:hypothetical protein
MAGDVRHYNYVLYLFLQLTRVVKSILLNVP